MEPPPRRDAQDIGHLQNPHSLYGKSSRDIMWKARKKENGAPSRLVQNVYR